MNNSPQTSIDRSQLSTKEGLVALTNRLPEGAFFLEHSRARELAYIDRSFARWREVVEIARARLGDTQRLSCMDIGASPFTFYLGSWFKKVSALDLSASLRERCEAAGIKLQEGGVGSLASLTNIEPVDCVFFLEVIEHLHLDPITVLRDIRRLLKPGATLFLSTPNLMCFANRVLMLRNRKLHHFSYPPFSLYDRAHGHGHDRIYMPAELREYFEYAGYRNVEVLYQLNVDDTAHRSEGLVRRLAAQGPRLLKLAFPSLRDGILMVGRNSLVI
jgi:SAM-dependent methyltransferase